MSKCQIRIQSFCLKDAAENCEEQEKRLPIRTAVHKWPLRKHMRFRYEDTAVRRIKCKSAEDHRLRSPEYETASEESCPPKR